MKELDLLIKMANQLKELIGKDLSSYLIDGTTNDFSEYLELLKQFGIIMETVGIKIEDYSGKCNNMKDLFSSMKKTEESVCVIKTTVDDLMNEILDLSIEKNQKYCVIQREDAIPGLASHIITNLGYIEECILEGKIPVVDMLNGETDFAKLGKAKGKNAWELFFNQPFGNKLQDIQANTVIDKKTGIPKLMPSYDMEFLSNEALIGKWRRLCHIYMKPAEEVLRQIEEAKKNTPFAAGERIVGVLCRGTDYTQKRPLNHPVQPKPQEVLDKVKEVCERYHCKYCYLATEDEKIVNFFRENMGDSVFTSQDIYYSEVHGKVLFKINQEKGIDIYKKNMEYLAALFLLAECNCFVGGRTSGTVAALLFSNGFEYFYTWNKGRYGKDDILSV